MKASIKTKKEQRDELLDLITAGKYEQAHGYASALGYPEGVTAEVFEDFIVQDGLIDSVILAIKKFYDNDYFGGGEE